MAFGMADILLEPFGGQVLGLSVASTTKLTALLALGGLCGFGLAAYVLGRGGDPYRMTLNGAVIGLPAFALVIAAAPLELPALFLVGNFAVGFGAAVFGHGTLTFTMNAAPPEQSGLALGAWGAVQATAAGAGMALSGPIRDGINAVTGSSGSFLGLPTSASGYIAVYSIEITLLVVAIAATLPLILGRNADESPSAGTLFFGDEAAGPSGSGS